MPEKKEATAAAKKEQPAWRVAIDLNDGHDFSIPCPTREEALATVEQIISAGFVTVDRKMDMTRYDSTVYPLHQIKSFHVFEV